MNFRESPNKVKQKAKMHLSEDMFNSYEQTEGKDKLQAGFNNLKDMINDLAVEAFNNGNEELYDLYQELLNVMNSRNVLDEDASEDFFNRIIDEVGPKL